LRFGKCEWEITVDTHGLTGGFHFRAKDNVNAWEARKGEHRFFDADM